MITQTINLNLIPGGVLPRINVSQYDKGSRTLNFNIYNGSVLFNIPTGSTITIQGTKPDHTGFQYSCEYEGSVVTADLEQQMSVISGEVTCEITINKDLQLIGTGNFILNVEPAAVKDDTVISETELPLIEQAIEAAAEAEASAISAAESAEEAASWSAHPPYIGENGNWYVYDPETEEFVDTGDPSRGPQGIQGETGPKGDTGATPDIAMNASVDNTSGTPAVVVTETGTDEDPVFSLAFSGLKGPQGDTGATGETGPQGPTGPTGNGISNITKTGTSGLVDTYTITYTDGTTSTFTVTNGRDGTGSGDMSMSDYDPTGSVKNDGGIPDFIADQISGKQNIILASALPIGGTTQTTVEGALGALNTAKQNIVLASALTIGGQQITEVEPALHALNNKDGGHTIVDEEGTTYPARAKLKFINCDITDDSTNDTTIIEAEGGGGSTLTATLSFTTNNSAFHGQTITVKDGNDTTLTTTTFSNQGTATATLMGSAGYYYASVVAYGVTKTEQIALTESGSYNVALNSDTILGAWLYKGGLDYTDYANFAAVEADEKAIRRLMTIHASVEYLAECGSATDSLVLSIINSDICAKWINLRDYALDTLYANTYLKAMMDTADKYFYGEWVITDNTTTPPTWGAKGNVPVMNADDAPYGQAFANSYLGDTTRPYKAFDGSDSTLWCTSTQGTTGADLYVGYKFTNPVCVKRCSFKLNSSTVSSMTYKIQGSNDNSSWTDLTEQKTVTSAETIDITNDNYYLYYRVYIVSETMASSIYFGRIETLQFYGRELRESVPTMTSNTAPYGVASSSSDYSGYYAYGVFNGNESADEYGWQSSGNVPQWIQYQFSSPVVANMAYIKARAMLDATTSGVKDFEILASNDNSTFTKLYEGTHPSTNTGSMMVTFENNTPYTYYRFSIKTTYASNNHAGVRELQFYGLNYTEYDWDVKHPRKYLYDHGVEVEQIDYSSCVDGNTGTSIVSTNNEIKLTYTQSSSGAGAIVVLSNSSINLSNYNYIRVLLGSKLVSYSVQENSIGAILVFTSKPTNYSTYGSYRVSESHKSIPLSDRSNSLDISSVMQADYCGYGIRGNTSGNTLIMTFTEWWLE